MFELDVDEEPRKIRASLSDKRIVGEFSKHARLLVLQILSEEGSCREVSSPSKDEALRQCGHELVDKEWGEQSQK